MARAIVSTYDCVYTNLQCTATSTSSACHPCPWQCEKYPPICKQMFFTVSHMSCFVRNVKNMWEIVLFNTALIILFGARYLRQTKISGRSWYSSIFRFLPSCLIRSWSFPGCLQWQQTWVQPQSRFLQALRLILSSKCRVMAMIKGSIYMQTLHKGDCPFTRIHVKYPKLIKAMLKVLHLWMSEELKRRY